MRWLRFVRRNAILVGAAVILTGPTLFHLAEYGAKLALVSIRGESRGTPPYRSKVEAWLEDGKSIPPDRTIISGSERVAMFDFPDAASCKAWGYRDARPRMAWRRIGNAAEAQVCVFRVMAEIGQIDAAAAWLESEGFKLFPPNASECNRDYCRRSGSWSVRDRGMPYSAGVWPWNRVPEIFGYRLHLDTYWSLDGGALRFVDSGAAYK